MESVDYVATWTGMTGGATRPTVIRLELKIDGLRARPRLLFTGHAMEPLWLFADGAGSAWCFIPAATDPCPRWSASGCSARPPPGAASVES